MNTAEIIIENEIGLHARPASNLIKLTKTFNSDIRLISDGKNGNGKSIISILGLGLKKGDKVLIETEGDDEEEALKALLELANNNFGE